MFPLAPTTITLDDLELL